MELRNENFDPVVTKRITFAGREQSIGDGDGDHPGMIGDDSVGRIPSGFQTLAKSTTVTTVCRRETLGYAKLLYSMYMAGITTRPHNAPLPSQTKNKHALVNTSGVL